MSASKNIRNVERNSVVGGRILYQRKTAKQYTTKYKKTSIW